MDQERNKGVLLSRELPSGDDLSALAGWNARKTAILVIHGIGDQFPMETLDAFGRTLTEVLEQVPGTEVDLSHALSRRDDKGSVWFDSSLRLRNRKNPDRGGIDLFEYYWAHQTEDKIRPGDIEGWITEVTYAASAFYRENRFLAERQEGEGPLTKSGRFRKGRYRFMLLLVGNVVPALSWSAEALLRAVSLIPFLGMALRGFLNQKFSGAKKRIVNTLGDIVAYTTSDRKSRFYEVRQGILGGAVTALRSLLEHADDAPPPYERVVVVGHSLGSQVAHDAINRLVQLVNEKQLQGWDEKGRCLGQPSLALGDVFHGLVTLGSPLDKIAFFLREQVPRDQYLRRQLVANFHSFKQRDWDLGDDAFTVKKPFETLLDDMLWFNYYDKHDPVSGSLDFYRGVTNIRTNLPPSLFTHNDYWSWAPLYFDVVRRLLV